jgi:DNA-binding LacI/PurR family transcriptional regulator
MGIRQLARELGLSIGTVSRALNDRPDVSAATRARVKEAAQRIGYVPDQSGRSLRTGLTGMIGGLLPAPGAAPGPEAALLRVFEGTRRRLREAGLDLVLLVADEDENPLAGLRRVVGRHIADGLVLTRTRIGDPRLALLKERGIPHVVLGRGGPPPPGAWADLDFEAATVGAVDMLAAAGHRRLGLLLREPSGHFATLLEAAFTARTARHGLGDAAAPVLRIGPGGVAAARDRLAALAPSALLTADDALAAELYPVLASLGRAVGRDVAVICLFPALYADVFQPRLSHYTADLERLGRELAERLLLSFPGARDRLPDPGPPRPTPMTFAPRDSHLALAPGSRAAR